VAIEGAGGCSLQPNTRAAGSKSPLRQSLIFLLSRFWAFRNKRGVQKKKSPSGLSTKKCGFFFPPFFFIPSVVLLDLFNRVFRRFLTRGVKKRDKKNHGKFSASAKKKTYLRHFFSPTAPLAFAWGLVHVT
jgi:hypothetical protein